MSVSKVSQQMLTIMETKILHSAMASKVSQHFMSFLLLLLLYHCYLQTKCSIATSQLVHLKSNLTGMMCTYVTLLAQNSNFLFTLNSAVSYLLWYVIGASAPSDSGLLFK